jgi:hypothetical protein
MWGISVLIGLSVLIGSSTGDSQRYCDWRMKPRIVVF